MKNFKSLEKDFACNGNIVKDDELGEVIQLQGDQRVKVSEFLTAQLQLPKKTSKSTVSKFYGNNKQVTGIEWNLFL